MPALEAGNRIGLERTGIDRRRNDDDRFLLLAIAGRSRLGPLRTVSARWVRSGSRLTAPFVPLASGGGFGFAEVA